MKNTTQEAPLANQVNQACARLGISRTALYGMIGKGQIRPVKIAGRVLIPESELQRVLADAIKVAA